LSKGMGGKWPAYKQKQTQCPIEMWNKYKKIP
jgi:hypothetical protein